MQKLKRLDTIAYIRFASVYRSFEDMHQFKTLVDEVRSYAMKLRERARIFALLGPSTSFFTPFNSQFHGFRFPDLRS